MNYLNKSGLPEWLIPALTHSDYPDLPDNFIGVTTLIDSPRIRIFNGLFPNQEVDVMTLSNMMIGSAVHEYFEKYGGQLLREVRLSQAVGINSKQFTITGQVDVIDEAVVYDIKTAKASYASYGIKDEWIKQVSIYRWLAMNNGINVEGAKIVCVYKDWSLGAARHGGGGYPPNPIEVIEVPLLSLDETHAYVLERLKAHFFNGVEAPECTSAERWQDDVVYAIYQGSSKRAKKLCNSMDEAEENLANLNLDIKDVPLLTGVANNESGYYIVRRPEVWRRCEGFCAFSEVCEQYAGHRHQVTGI